MAKNDYDTVLYKLLIYLYACMKREIIFDETVFDQTIRTCAGNEQYFNEILSMAQDEGLIRDVTIVRAWGTDILIASPLEDMKITSAGIHYLKENSQMKKVGTMLLESVDIFSSLIKVLGLM